MPGPTDAELLSDWLDRQREPAFHALVDRYAGLVHMAARRTTGGDDSLAAEASQLAFITLARKARSLAGRSSLAGWLHATAVLQARNLLRQRAREIRKLHILRTHMEHESQASPAADWQRVQPVLDEALAALSTKDRETLLLRFYRSLSVREIGAALGIATDAAQKRLDRATEKLRGQLARRGCQVGGPLGVVLLAGFTADAKGAAIPSSSMLASNALTAASAGSTATLTTIGIIAMTKKAAITAGVVVLLAGAGTAVFLNQNKEQAAPGGPAAPAKSASSHSTTTSGLAPTESTAKSERPKVREAAADDSALVTKYGESRTNLSKHVATQLIGVLEDAVAMGELAMSDQNAAMFGGRRGGMRGAIGGDLADKLAMSDEQQEKAGEIFKDYQKRELAKTKESVESMKKDPTALMTLMLASDAQSNGKMTADEFKEVQASISDDLKGTINPLDRKNFQGGQPMKDATFRSEMAAILEPDQAETFKSAAAEQDAKKADDRSMNNLPSMKLEEMDTTVSSAKKMTSGMKSMMEGMGGLGPLMEMEKKKREAEEAAKAAAGGAAPAVPTTPAGQ